jgi:polyribonucleotide nucleotidyltransferase
MPFTRRTPNVITKTTQRGRDTVTISTGKLAPQADGAIEIRFNDNVFLVTAVMKKTPDLKKVTLLLGKSVVEG